MGTVIPKAGQDFIHDVEDAEPGAPAGDLCRFDPFLQNHFVEPAFPHDLTDVFRRLRVQDDALAAAAFCWFDDKGGSQFIPGLLQRLFKMVLIGENEAIGHRNAAPHQFQVHGGFIAAPDHALRVVDDLSAGPLQL